MRILSCRCEIETYGKGSEKLAETEIKRSKKVVAMGLQAHCHDCSGCFRWKTYQSDSYSTC